MLEIWEALKVSTKPMRRNVDQKQTRDGGQESELHTPKAKCISCDKTPASCRTNDLIVATGNPQQLEGLLQKQMEALKNGDLSSRQKALGILEVLSMCASLYKILHAFSL